MRSSLNKYLLEQDSHGLVAGPGIRFTGCEGVTAGLGTASWPLGAWLGFAVWRRSSAARAAHREQARSYICFGPITFVPTRATALLVRRYI